jgi:hypothetical protein
VNGCPLELRQPTHSHVVEVLAAIEALRLISDITTTTVLSSSLAEDISRSHDTDHTI